MIFALVLGGLLSIAVTVLLCIKVLPAKYDGTFSKKMMQFLHDFFNFKKLYLESVLKILYTFLSIASFVGGILIATVGNIFQFIGRMSYAIEYDYFDLLFTQLFTNFAIGLAIAIVAPIVLRLLYEGAIMFILLVKNVIEINNKTKSDDDK